MKPLISVVMAYHNRKPLLYQTLQSMAFSSQIKWTEIIIVDDGSDPDHRIEDIAEAVYKGCRVKLNIKIIRIEPEDKWYSNPCIPYNIGFKEAQGDVIVIQNPECYHLGDVLAVASEIKYNDYISYHCYSLDKPTTNLLPTIDPRNLISKGLAYTNVHQARGIQFADWLADILPFWPLPNHAVNIEGGSGYYNHSQLRPTMYHFCAAVSRVDLEDLGGFDERYAQGFGFDDNELVARIKRKGMNAAFCPYPMVLHQHHYTESKQYEVWDNHLAENKAKLKRNQDLYHNITLKESGWKANAKTNS